MKDTLLQKAADLLRPILDFPKPGILFWDIALILRDREVLDHLVDLLADRWKGEEIDVVAGFDARGFIFGSLIAKKLGIGFEQIRKVGKLPGQVRSLEYELEYGSAVQEMIADGYIAGKRVLLSDDLLATGGTAFCGAKLVEELGGTVVGLSVITEIAELGGRGLLADFRVHSLITTVDDVKVIDADYCVDMVAHDINTGAVILIERLNYPEGVATPGGHIEDESARAAAIRELREEIGCTPHKIDFHSTLTQINRDPRGIKISLVMSCLVDSRNACGETGKTEVLKISSKEDLPPNEDFVLGHGPSVRAIWPKVCESESVM